MNDFNYKNDEICYVYNGLSDTTYAYLKGHVGIYGSGKDRQKATEALIGSWEYWEGIRNER